MAPYLSVVVLLALSTTCRAGKILVYPIDGSHWLNMNILLEALHAGGHRITVLRTATSWYVAEKSPFYTSVTLPVRRSHSIESPDYMSSFLARSMDIRRCRGSPWAFVDFYRNIYSLIGESQVAVADTVAAILENRTLSRELREARYDICLTDPGFPGGVLLAHFLDLPTVFNVRWLFNGEAHFAIAPSPLSYVPELFSGYSDKMDFWQRLGNVVYHAALVYMFHAVSEPPYRALCERHFAGEVDIMSLTQGADLWLVRVDFTFELPRPTMPNVVYIGGFQGKPARPLPPDLEDFVQSSGDHGVVVMTLGTLLGDLGPEISGALASVFAALPQKVVWRHTGKRPPTLGNNTLLVDWLPQNDLLGHPKTKVFVTHGGTNGLYQAIYHAVPVLGIPLIFDQHDNMVRMEARGVGAAVDVTALDAESFAAVLGDVLDPEKPYKRNMVELSRLHRDKPVEPLRAAVFWVEYVMRHGGAAHLRTESYKMPWYAYHSLDVYAFLAFFAFLLVALPCLACRGLCRQLGKANSYAVKPKKE